MTRPTTPKREPDLAQARRFLELLDPEAETFHFQTFADPKPETFDNEAQRKGLARALHGSLEEHTETLTRLNNRGAGVFVTINAVLGARRTNRNVQRIRACFADFDPPKTEPAPARFPLDPVITVETSPGRRHVYWTVDGLPVAAFSPQQQAIVAALGSDPAPTDPARVMRLPGFWHVKDPAAPHLVRIIDEDPRLPYTPEQIAAAFPPQGASREARDKPDLGSDPIARALGDRGLALDWKPDGGLFVRCPWSDEHTTPSTPTSSIYYPPHTGGYSGGAYVCQHAHCRDRTIADLRRFLREDGTDDPGAKRKASGLHQEEFQNNSASNPFGSFATGVQPTRNPLETHSQPARMEWGSLVDEFVDDKGQTKQRRKIDSLAAVVVADALRDELAWDADAGCWLTWQESHWQTHIQPSPADTLLAHAVRIGCGEHGYRLSYLSGITQLVQRLDLLARPARPEGVVPFRNGLLDLATGELYAPTPSHALDWCLPHDYDPKATCPSIHAWLLRATDHDGETVELLRAWLAALVRGIPLQKFLVLIGRGGTGKGTFQRLAAALVGDANVAISTLRDLEGNRFETAKLYGKRLCMINEAGRHGGALNMLKSMTGGDALPLERKHQQQTGTFVFDGLTLLATNEDVQSTDATSGLERRRVTVRFPTTATEAERADWQARGGEAGVLHAEIPGLINWLLQLDERAIRQRFEQLPESVRKENLLGMAAGNPVADWLINCTVADPDAYLQIGSLGQDEQGRPTFKHAHDWAYPNYRAYCIETGRDRPVSIVKFRETVKDIAQELGRPVTEQRHPVHRSMMLRGIRLAANPFVTERVASGLEWDKPLKRMNRMGCDEVSSEKNPDDPDHTEETHRYVM
ncbi:phage/plasmid primase, P4 family [Halochromatium glycolicum]|uniref:phage/plasmid primase, P4 family n=1 Tax=Halochromatium glycolicum TaxID=85075 RepID=UPI00190C4779|nr:phage/plasmid primase, P4 family [Halochromatium glycolicum]